MSGNEDLSPDLKTGRAHQDPTRRRGKGIGFVQSAPDPNPIAPARGGKERVPRHADLR